MLGIIAGMALLRCIRSFSAEMLGMRDLVLAGAG